MSDNYKVTLSPNEDKWLLWKDNEVVAAMWEWYAADEDDAYDMFDFYGHIE